MILISNDFCHKIKMYNFEPYTVLLAIATDIPVMTAFVLQGHCNTVREEGGGNRRTLNTLIIK